MTNKEKYYQIINTGLKNNPETGYYEGHHIVPKSICPLLKNSQNNIVYLTAKNHFLAHYYLWKWFKEELNDKKWSKKMCYAFNMMKRIISKSDDVEKLSELYDEVRKDLSEIRSETNKGNKYNLGKHLSDETKKKISDAHKGKHHTEEKRNISERQKIPVLQFTKDMTFLQEWKSIKEAGNTLGINSSTITQCCKNKKKSCGGYVWKYKEEKKTD